MIVVLQLLVLGGLGTAAALAWRAAGGKTLRTNQETIRRILASPDGTKIATLGWRPGVQRPLSFGGFPGSEVTVEVWSLDADPRRLSERAFVDSLGGNEPSVAFLGDEVLVAGFSNGPCNHILRVSDGSVALSLPRTSCSLVALSPTGEVVTEEQRDDDDRGYVTGVSLRALTQSGAGRSFFPRTPRRNGIKAVAFSATGSHLAVLSRVFGADGLELVSVFEVATGRLVYEIPFEKGVSVRQLALSRDGTKLGVWATSLEGPIDRHEALVFSWSGGELARADRRVVFTYTGRVQHGDEGLTFDPAGRSLATFASVLSLDGEQAMLRVPRADHATFLPTGALLFGTDDGGELKLVPPGPLGRYRNLAPPAQPSGVYECPKCPLTSSFPGTCPQCDVPFKRQG